MRGGCAFPMRNGNGVGGMIVVFETYADDEKGGKSGVRIACCGKAVRGVNESAIMITLFKNPPIDPFCRKSKRLCLKCARTGVWFRDFSARAF